MFNKELKEKVAALEARSLANEKAIEKLAFLLSYPAKYKVGQVVNGYTVCEVLLNTPRISTHYCTLGPVDYNIYGFFWTYKAIKKGSEKVIYIG